MKLEERYCKWLLGAVLMLLPWMGWADEGMWMPGRLDKQTQKLMKELGLQLSARQLYHPKKASLKDAVVSFGGFCSGVVVSEDGLVFTNHHCGFSSIQQHSSVQHDYLKQGFVAKNRHEELPNPELYVRFLLRQEEVTRRVLQGVTPAMSEAQRTAVVDSMMLVIGAEVSAQDSTLVGVVDAYYGGNEFWLSVYRDYNDVRLVFAPPSSVGKFGWDKDNWMWPRHTGDFCVFRIYADKDNRPADYSPENVPYHPDYVAPVSLAGYQEGDFCMTYGYPGSTDRYLSSYGIEERMNHANQAQIDVRGIKQAIWKREMERHDDIRIKYASKYDESSNYWKNSIGTNRAIQKLGVLQKKRALEQELRRWIRTQSGDTALLRLFTNLELNYKSRREIHRAQAYFVETFLNAPELVQQALAILNFDFEGERERVVAGLKKIVETYANMDATIDKEVLAAMLDVYAQKVDSAYWPEVYHTISTQYGGNRQAYVDALYAQTQLSTVSGLQRFLEQDTTYHFLNDPAVTLGIDLITKFFEMSMQMQEASVSIERGERLLNEAVRRMYATRNFYPDANSTLRLSFGTIGGYEPFDGAVYDYYTTAKGVLEKARTHAGNPDFEVQPELLSLLSAADYGPYADEKGDLRVCFISDNDITGGNSGSAMFNARGELLGLAFDGNWEAMSGDLLFEPQTQRTIGVDVRYILFLMEYQGKAQHLIQELKLVR